MRVVTAGNGPTTLRALQATRVPRPRTSDVRPNRSVAERACLFAVLAVAAALRIAPWLKPHVFLGVMEYDDGVYYAASRSLLHGLVPYRDFTIVHPPLTSILLLPAAGIGALVGDPGGMAAARVEVVLAELLNVWLVYRLTRIAARGTDKFRRWAPFVAAALYAVAPGAVAAGHTVLLEPFTNLLTLTAMLLLLRGEGSVRSDAMSGALVAAALGVKMFAAVYLAAAVIWLCVTARSRIRAFATGFGAAVVVVFAPFAIVAGPARLWRDLVTTQLTRPADGSMSASGRVRSMTGLTALSVPVTMLLLTAGAIVAAAIVMTVRRRGMPLSSHLLLWVLVAAGIGVAFARSPSYFDHYAGFFAAPLAVSAGIVLAASSAVGLTWRAATVGVTIALAVPASFWSLKGDLAWRSDPSLQAVDARVPAGACVYADAVSLAVAADRFRPPSPSCPGWLDGRGQNLVWSHGRTVPHFYPHGFLANGRWQQQTQRQLDAAAFLLVRSDPTRMPEWTPALRAYVARHFQLVWTGSGRIPAQLWART
jgi:4-amino-4-deoxy-L-arabinose transferase-like glycosyltransferase